MQNASEWKDRVELLLTVLPKIARARKSVSHLVRD